MPAHLERVRLQLTDGAATTAHVARYDLARHSLRVVSLRKPQPLEAWCAQHDVTEALVGGFYTRPDGVALGELRTAGMARRHVPFDSPWDKQRASVHIHRGVVRIARRPAFGNAPRGDLLQAGPLLVADGAVAFADGEDTEGFSAGAKQFDSDISDGRYPRAALGVARGTLLSVACDGRADDEAGLTLSELAEAMLALGATEALNLDGGGSTSLVCGGRLRNVARESHGRALPGGRAVSSALVVTLSG